MTTITPEQFMAQPPEPDEEVLEQTPTIDFGHLIHLPLNPLESIALSLGQLVEHFHGGGAQAATSSDQDEHIRVLGELNDDLAAKSDALYALVEEIEAIIKPSTSKLANQVREAIGRWRDPEVPAEVEPDDPAAEAGEAPEHPSHDAPVEAWRDFARTMAPPYKWADIETMNRSQLRSLLGIPQPGTPVAPSVVHS